jgi:hypothetical protein
MQNDYTIIISMKFPIAVGHWAKFQNQDNGDNIDSEDNIDSKNSIDSVL